MDKNYGGPREIRSSPYLLPTGTFRNQAKILLCHLLQQEHVWTGESEELSVQIELNKRRGWKCGRGFGLLMVGYRVQHHPARQRKRFFFSYGSRSEASVVSQSFSMAYELCKKFYTNPRSCSTCLSSATDL